MAVDGLIERFFHPREILAARARNSGAVLSFAARFAAKEAFGKALGTGMRGLKLCDIEVINHHNGRPDIVLHRRALEALHARGGRQLHVSMTHEKSSAVAVVIIEGE